MEKNAILPSHPLELPTLNAHDLITSKNDRDFLGKGASATVRKCHHLSLGNMLFVVKCFAMVGSKSAMKKAIKDSEREAKVLMRCCHKNIVKIYGLAEWSGCRGIVMELVKGPNLEDFLKSRNIKDIPWLLRLRFVKEIFEGLSYLHYHDKKHIFIHGDLKPQNILLTSDLTIKLADFGSVSITLATGASKASLDVVSTTQHTLFYTAPELLKNFNISRTRAMDVYSASMIIYEIITRHTVYQGVKPGVIMQLIIDKGQKPDLKLIDEAEQSLKQSTPNFKMFKYMKCIMEKCWMTDPSLRSEARKVCESLGELFQKFSSSDAQLYQTISELQRQYGISPQKETKTPMTRLSEFQPPFIECCTGVEIQDITGANGDQPVIGDNSHNNLVVQTHEKFQKANIPVPALHCDKNEQNSKTIENGENSRLRSLLPSVKVSSNSSSQKVQREKRRNAFPTDLRGKKNEVRYRSKVRRLADGCNIDAHLSFLLFGSPVKDSRIIMQRFCQNRVFIPNPNQEPGSTIVYIGGKNVSIKIKVEINDGQMSSLIKSIQSWRPNGVIIAFDVANNYNFTKTSNLLQQIRSCRALDAAKMSTHISLLGQSSGAFRRNAIVEDGKKLAKENSLKYYEANPSCRDNVNIDAVFQAIAFDILQKRQTLGSNENIV